MAVNCALLFTDSANRSGRITFAVPTTLQRFEVDLRISDWQRQGIRHPIRRGLDSHRQRIRDNAPSFRLPKVLFQAVRFALHAEGGKNCQDKSDNRHNQGGGNHKSPATCEPGYSLPDLRPVLMRQNRPAVRISFLRTWRQTAP